MELVTIFFLGLIGLFWPVVALMALALLVRICVATKRSVAIAEENLEVNRLRTAHLEKIAMALVSMNKSTSQDNMPL